MTDADLSLVPKTVTEGGRTLNLADVKWSGGEDGSYTATASYTGSVSNRYCTGYTVTADYTGEVAKTSCEIVTYTAIFGCTEVPYSNTSAPQADSNQNCEGQKDGSSESKGPEDGSSESRGTENAPTEDSSPAANASAPSGGSVSTALSIAGCMGGIASLLAAGYWGYEKFKERKTTT